eukprot:CAMPEP_0170510010 /NCGR_PEP_ID=MMETSP0208-20121228/65531_1 /TAXON_ID=197538 /ORGANISM="Strombidium inclinatum, Strain S3" /LENGTH=147 /DNA_ID=CAMNT_0010793427 /DNA_START=507 /DNA_END=950 /DNA_ORIENTATION=+
MGLRAGDEECETRVPPFYPRGPSLFREMRSPLSRSPEASRTIWPEVVRGISASSSVSALLRLETERWPETIFLLSGVCACFNLCPDLLGLDLAEAFISSLMISITMSELLFLAPAGCPGFGLETPTADSGVFVADDLPSDYFAPDGC